MKKLYFSLFMAACTASLVAQPTINAGNHTPVGGDTYSTKQADPNSVSVGGNGASINWNFNSIVTLTNAPANYSVTVGTFTGWPSASVSVGSGTADISYYSGTATELKYWGGALTLGAAPCQLQFSQPAVFMAYPTSLNTTTNSNISGTVTAVGNTGNFVGTCSVSALATGTMILPTQTFSSVIRVTQNISISFTVGGFPGTANRILNEWYSTADSKYPILAHDQSTISSFAGTSTQVAVYVQSPYVLGAKENAADVAVKISAFPNPVNDMLHITSDAISAKNVLMFDVTGKQIENHSMINGSLNLNTSNYAGGVYFYKVMDADNRHLKTGRITVVH